MLFGSYTTTNNLQVIIDMYVFIIYLQLSCRRIKLMFKQIKEKLIRTDYALLQKICCRDYDEQIKVFDVIEGTCVLQQV